MDTKLLETIKQYGLSDNDAKIYITILELGQASIAIISRKTNIKRTSIYGMIDNLKKEGIAQEITKNKTKYFSVVNPDILLKNMEKKYTNFKETLPELMTLIGKFGDRPRITFYEGKQQIQEMLYEHYPLRAISMAKEDYTRRGYQDHRFAEEYIEWLKRQRKEKSEKEKIKLFTNKSTIESSTLKNKISNRKMKFIPKGCGFKSTFRICGDYIIMLVFKDQKQYAYEIQDNMLSNNIREIFKMLWKIIK